MTRIITLRVEVRELAHGSQIDYQITTKPPVPEGASTPTTRLRADLVACVEAFKRASGTAKEGA